MKARHVAVCGFIAFGICIECAQADLYLYGGGPYAIDYPVFEPVLVDSWRPSDGTRVELSDGGVIYAHMETHGISRVTISGGWIGAHLSAQGSSNVRIQGGIIMGPVFALQYGQVEVCAGRMNSLQVYDSSHVELSGGTVMTMIRVSGTATLVVHGREFFIDGRPVGYGDSARDYGHSGQLKGVLAGGAILDNRYVLAELGDITFVPEPASGVLLGVGGLLALRRKRSTRDASNHG